MSADTKEKTTDEELQKITGINSADETAMEARAEKDEAKRVNDQVGKGFTEDDSGDSKAPKKGGWITKKRAAVSGGIATLVVGGTIGILSFGQGPFKLIHAGQLLQQFHFSDDENFMDSRTGKIIRWARTRNSQERRNLDFFGNKIADRYETRLRNAGMEPHYSNGRIDAITFDNKQPKARDALNEIKARGDIDVPPPDADGKVRLELPTGFNSTRFRRSILKGVINGIGLGKISSAISKRILTMRAGVDYHLFRNVTRNLDENFWDYVKRVREDWAEKHKTGEIDTDTRYEGADDTDADGNSTDNPANNDAARGAADIADGDIPSIKGQLTDVFTKGVGIAGAATIICSLDQLGDTIPKIRQANMVLPLMRVGMDIVAGGNQVMAGEDMNLDEIGALVTKFYDKSAPKGSQEFFGAKTFQAELGEEQTGPDMPNGAKPNTDRPQVFQVIDVITGATGISQVCGFVTSTAGGWAVDIADWATSGGPASALVAAVTDTLAGVALGSFVDDIARWLAGEPLDLVGVLGANLGNYANFGVRLAANEGAISHGGVAMSAAAEAELQKESELVARAEFQQKSAVDRYLNPYESRSLVSQAMIRNPELSSPTDSIASFLGSPLKTISSIFSNASTAFVPSATASHNGSYDYGFPEYGFDLATMDDERYEDPFANAERVEPKLAEYNDRFGDCFGTVINPQTFEINVRTTEGVRYDLIEAGKDNEDGNYSECKSGSQELLDYRFYLADQYVTKSMACHENLDTKVCDEIIRGIEEPEGGPVTGGGPVASPGQDTSGIPCPADPDITDGGLAEKYGPGRVLQYRIRLCILFGDPKMDVNVSIAQNAANMVRAAAGAGLTLRGGGYRTFDEQVALRSVNGCPDTYSSPSSTCATPTARPGSSNHESGEAIDVTCGGTIIRSRSTACFQWLQANAGNYSLFNLPSEAWHWSIDGS